MRGERMRSGVGLVTVVVAALAAIAFVSRRDRPGVASGVDRVGWTDDLTAARRTAAAGRRPVLMDFSAGWCPACQQMARQTWTDASAATAVSAAGCVPVRVDADAHPELGQQYAVEYLPTLVLTDAAGHELRRSVGFLSAAEVRDWLGNKTLP